MVTPSRPCQGMRKIGHWRMRGVASSSSRGEKRSKSHARARWVKTTRKDAIPRSPYSHIVRRNLFSWQHWRITHVDPFHTLPWVTLHVGVAGFPRKVVEDAGINIIRSNVVHGDYGEQLSKGTRCSNQRPVIGLYILLASREWREGMLGLGRRNSPETINE